MKIKKLDTIFRCCMLVAMAIPLMFYFFNMYRHYSSKPLVVENSPLDLGKVKPSSSVNLFFFLKNSSKQPVQVLGVAPSCDCMTTHFVTPVVLAGGETRLIPFSMVFPNESDRIARDMIIYTDNVSQRTVTASVSADVVGSLP